MSVFSTLCFSMLEKNFSRHSERSRTANPDRNENKWIPNNGVGDPSMRVALNQSGHRAMFLRTVRTRRNKHCFILRPQSKFRVLIYSHYPWVRPKLGLFFDKQRPSTPDGGRLDGCECCENSELIFFEHTAECKRRTACERPKNVSQHLHHSSSALPANNVNSPEIWPLIYLINLVIHFLCAPGFCALAGLLFH